MLSVLSCIQEGQPTNKIGTRRVLLEKREQIRGRAVKHLAPYQFQSVLQCVAVCCSVLQCVAVCCSVLQCVAVCCSVLAQEKLQARTKKKNNLLQNLLFVCAAPLRLVILCVLVSFHRSFLTYAGLF